MRYLRDPRPLLFRKSRRIRRWWQTACRTDCRLRQCTAAGLYRESLHSGCRSSSGSSWIPCRLSDLLYWKTGFLPPSHKQRPTRSNEWYHFRPSADCRRRSGRYNPVRRTGVLPFLHRQMCPRRSVRRLWSPLPWSHCRSHCLCIGGLCRLFRGSRCFCLGLFCGRLCAALRQTGRGCCDLAAAGNTRQHSCCQQRSQPKLFIRLFHLCFPPKECLASQPFFHDIP